MSSPTPPDGEQVRRLVVRGRTGSKQVDTQELLLAGNEGGCAQRRIRVVRDEDYGDFRVVLVGVDGTEKASWDEPVDADEVFAVVDDMPLRRAVVARGED